MTENLIHLRRPGVSVVVDVSVGVPVIAHWGRELETIDRESILGSVFLPKQPGGVDVTAPIAVVPQHSRPTPSLCRHIQTPVSRASTHVCNL